MASCRKILGDPAQATIRASFGVSYNSDGLWTFPGVYNAIPGNQITTSRTATSTQFPLVPAGESWPVLLREPEPPGAVARHPGRTCLPDGGRLQQRRQHRSSELQDAVLAVVSPLGLQRSIGQRMAIEVRYVGTRLVDGTATEDWNEVNWTTNGFLNEFKLAQANLAANIAAGGARANSFAYFGPGTGTSPLPIYLANFNGQPQANAGNRGALHGHELDEHRPARRAGGAQPESGRRREYALDDHGVPRQHAGRRATRATSS